MSLVGTAALRGHEGVRLPDLAISAKTPTKIAQRGRAALLHLIEAHECAGELARELWDFAIEIATLRQEGLSDSGLRWLVCKGYVEHARELTMSGDDGRHFRKAAGLTFHKRTCFVLSAEGVTYLRQVLEENPASEPAPASEKIHGVNGVMLNGAAHHGLNGHGLTDASEILIPKWDSARQRLSLGSTIIKEFKVPAANQEMIIAAFNEEGWPPRVDDPLPPQPEQDPKRRLHDTINSLNRNQKKFLIRFLGDGSGQGVRWELAQADAESRNGHSS